MSDPGASATGQQGFIFTQLPRQSTQFGTGGRIVRLLPDGNIQVLSTGFDSAADPEVSFDAKRILFAGRRTQADRWQIFEMQADGSGLRQITSESFDCRNPIYQSRLFELDAPKPWYQVAFTGTSADGSNLYVVKPEGGPARRITYNVARNYEATMAPDGRVIFASQEPTRSALFGVNLDGTDYALFAPYTGGKAKRMPAITTNRLAVFVESAPGAWDGAGSLGAVSLRRNLKSYRALTQRAAGLFHSPSPLVNGQIVVAMRSATGGGTHGLYRFDPENRTAVKLFDDAQWHDVQARELAPRAEPDGRSTVVDEKDPTSLLYCLSAYTSDIPIAPGTKRVRILDGSGPRPGSRVIGETDIDEDGSFKVEIPANTPVKVQVLDARGVPVRSSSWIWARNKEKRGCIGCHEDGELVPENRLASAINRPAVPFVSGVKPHEAISYKKQIEPVLMQKCGNAACHTTDGLMKYVKAGDSRGSRLVESITAEHAALSRTPEKVLAKTRVRPMPPASLMQLTDEEKRTIIEWIDTGALRNRE